MKNKLLFILLTFSLSAAAQTKTLTINIENQPLKTIFKQIEMQSDFIFLYSDKDFDSNRRTSLHIENLTIEKTLEKLFAGTNHSFQISDRQILIVKRPASNDKPAPQTPTPSSDKKMITGIVRDPAGEVLTGVSVLVKGTTTGTITNIDGNFVLTAPQNATLIFSYMGFKTKELKLGEQTNLNIVMENDEQLLDEVVAVGYGSQRKISTIGAQSGIKNIEEMKQPVSNIGSVLAGRIAGVIGIQGNGEAGRDDNTQIWIRGVSTTTSTMPLILVDGVERTFNNIDPEDIESFQVLKDASATAVYGVRGANGVILINTKRGAVSRPRIKAEYNTGITSFTKIPQMADGVTYMQMANEAAMNKGEAPIYSAEAIRKTYTQEDPYLYPNVNYMKEIFRSHGTYHRANVNARGGSEFAQFYTSLGYYNEGGLYNVRPEEKYDGSMTFNRVNFVTNLTMQVTKHTEVEFGVKGEISDYNTPYYSAQDVFKAVMQVYPTKYPTTYPDNKIPFSDSGYDVYSPYSMVYRMGTNKRNTSETRADIRINQNLDFWLNGLSARALVAYDFYMRNDIQRPGKSPIRYIATGRDENGELLLRRTDNYNGQENWNYEKSQWGHRQYYLESAVNYEQKFAAHRVSGMLLYNMTDFSNVTAGTLMHAMPFRNLGLAGRGTYSYNDRYFAEANFGWNGAENFAPGKRMGFFPSFGAAWVPTNEKFMESLTPYLNFLKFRFSWGQAGNSNLDTATKGESNNRFMYLSTVEGANGYVFGEKLDDSYGGVRIGRTAVDVTWELSTKQNLGIDFNVWNNDLTFQIDFFKEHRKNIYLERKAVPTYIGIVTLPLGNLGTVDNSGFEVTADLTKKIGEWTVMFKGNFSYNHNEIVEDDTPIKPYKWLNTRGTSLNTREGYICDGFYTEADLTDPNVAKPKDIVVKAGDLKYRNLNPNDDNVIDASDKTRIGYPSVPQITYGIGTTIGWKNVTLGVFFQGVGQRTISISASDFKPFSDSSIRGNLYANITERWTAENPRQDALYPRLDYGMTTNAENYAESTFWLRDGSYMRLKTLDLSYNLPEKWTKKLKLNNARVYFLGYNLLTFTKFDMWDVELTDGTGSAYPNIKTYSVGVSFSFN